MTDGRGVGPQGGLTPYERRRVAMTLRHREEEAKEKEQEISTLDARLAKGWIWLDDPANQGREDWKAQEDRWLALVIDYCDACDELAAIRDWQSIEGRTMEERARQGTDLQTGGERTFW